MSNITNDKIPNVPNLRFDIIPWKKSNLGNICSGFDYGLGAESIEYNGLDKYIRITDIDDETSIYNTKNPVSPSFTDENCVVNSNDILFARTGASTGKTYLYKNNDGKLYFAGFLIRANVNKEFNSYFIFQQTKTIRYSNWVKMMSVRSGQPGINAKEYQKYEMWYPCLTIQNKIATFLSLIDERIATQSKIIEDLETEIISINHLMINNSKEVIYFKETCKFESKTKRQSGDGIDNGLYPFFTNQEKQTKYLDEYDFDGEYIIANTGGKANFRYFKGKFAVMADCLVIKISDSELTTYYINVLKGMQNFIDYVGFEGSGLKHLNKDWLINLKVPKFSEKFTNYILIIEKLNKKIQIEKDILSLYKKQKVYLLKHMFI